RACKRGASCGRRRGSRFERTSQQLSPGSAVAVPYATIDGGFERASRLGHSQAAIRAIADQTYFHVPAEHLGDLTWLAPLISERSEFLIPDGARLPAALAIDGSHTIARVRDGLPSVVYGYAQAAAAYVDLGMMES